MMLGVSFLLLLLLLISSRHVFTLVLDLPNEESWIPDVLDVTCIVIRLLLRNLLVLS